MRKFSKSIFNISLFLILLIVFLGSSYASDDMDFESDIDDEIDIDYDIYLDEDFDEEWDEEDLDDDLDEEWGGEDLDDDIEEYEDYNETRFSDFDFLKYKITCYLNNYGNSSLNWTDSQNFSDEYQIFLNNPSNYTLNKNLEGYGTYLKIYASVNSTFKDYNLTVNETQYLQFMVIYYLNNYGNVSVNYTFNESDDFANYTPPLHFLTSSFLGGAFFFETSPDSNNIFIANNKIVTNNENLTSNDNFTFFTCEAEFELPWFVILLVILLLMLFIL